MTKVSMWCGPDSVAQAVQQLDCCLDSLLLHAPRVLASMRGTYSEPTRAPSPVQVRRTASLPAGNDLRAARVWSREARKDRAPNMWRYRELLPVFDDEVPVTLGEGLTPLLHATRLGARLGLDWLYVKDESLNPTNSFKARGQSAAITRARAPRRLRCVSVRRPNAGQRHGRLCGAGWAGREGLPAARRQDPVCNANVCWTCGM